MDDLKVIAHIIKNSADDFDRFYRLSKLNKKELAKLAKLLGLNHEGHAIELRNRIYNYRG